MLPVADSLNQVFFASALILPVTYESLAVAGPVLQQLRHGKTHHFPEIFQDKVLHQLFPHQSLPHYVWIDPKGIVRAFTEGTEVNGANLSNALQRDVYPAKEKQDLRIAYDPAKPLFLGGNGGSGEGVRYQSLLSGYVPGLMAGLNISPYDPVKGQRFTVRNVSLQWLVNLAFGENGRWFNAARIRNRSRDSSRFVSPLSGQAYLDWLGSGQGYCYELQLSPDLATRAYPILQADIARLFPQYLVQVQRLRVPCLALVRTGLPDSLLRSKGGAAHLQISPFTCNLTNVSLAQMVARLERQYQQNTPLPLVDLTGFTSKVDLHLNAKMSDIRQINAGLAPYGLQFTERLAETDILTIADNLNYHP